MSWFDILKELQSKTGYAQLDFDNIVVEDCCEELWKELQEVLNEHNIVWNVFEDYSASGFAYAPISKYNFKPDFDYFINKNDPCKLIKDILRIIPVLPIKQGMYSRGYPLTRVNPLQLNDWATLRRAFIADIEDFMKKMKDCPPLIPKRKI